MMDSPMTPIRIGRREFVGCVSIAAAAALSGCASLVTHAVTPIDDVVRLRIDHYPELVKAGGSLRIQPAGQPDALYVLRGQDVDGKPTFTTLSPRCTHRGCTVDVAGPNLVCPCHGSTYTRGGAVLRGPAEAPLRSFPTTTTADVIEIRLRGES
jgi:Rieske Fe-S protein